MFHRIGVDADVGYQRFQQQEFQMMMMMKMRTMKNILVGTDTRMIHI